MEKLSEENYGLLESWIQNMVLEKWNTPNYQWAQGTVTSDTFMKSHVSKHSDLCLWSGSYREPSLLTLVLLWEGRNFKPEDLVAWWVWAGWELSATPVGRVPVFPAGGYCECSHLEYKCTLGIWLTRKTTGQQMGQARRPTGLSSPRNWLLLSDLGWCQQICVLGLLFEPRFSCVLHVSLEHTIVVLFFDF